MADNAASVGSLDFWVMFAILAALSHAGYPGPRGGENRPAAVKQARNFPFRRPTNRRLVNPIALSVRKKQQPAGTLRTSLTDW
jgi:hypothetical protein